MIGLAKPSNYLSHGTLNTLEQKRIVSKLCHKIVSKRTARVSISEVLQKRNIQNSGQMFNNELQLTGD